MDRGARGGHGLWGPSAHQECHAAKKSLPSPRRGWQGLDLGSVAAGLNLDGPVRGRRGKFLAHGLRGQKADPDGNWIAQTR